MSIVFLGAGSIDGWEEAGGFVGGVCSKKVQKVLKRMRPGDLKIHRKLITRYMIFPQIHSTALRMLAVTLGLMLTGHAQEWQREQGYRWREVNLHPGVPQISQTHEAVKSGFG